MQRAAGVLLPVFSLPTPYGVGALGDTARAFIDFLQRARQSYWQLLPVGPTSAGDSPYQSFSTYAGNPYFIDLDTLIAQGLLTRAEVDAACAGAQSARVDYGYLYYTRLTLLRKAFARADRAPAEAFALEQGWARDYAMFMAIKGHFDGAPLWEWPADIRRREPDALAHYGAFLAEEVAFHLFLQQKFFEQWAALKRYANEHGVRIIGDVPIYVARDSADLWTEPGQFALDEDLAPTEVAGVPPDYFSSTGQLWGNPLYNWQRMAEDGYAWWKRRMTAAGRMFDVVRIDHFRGLESYWAVPAGAPTAASGHWVPGPGRALIDAIRPCVQDVIAEDLGYLTDDVRALLAYSGFPGMKVLEFAFDAREPADYQPHRYPQNCVAYTGTHDNDTVAGWLKAAPHEAVAYAVSYLGLNSEEGRYRGMLRGILQSNAALAIAQMQDYLGLGSEARINTPSTLGGNWQWRLLPGQLTDALAQDMAAMAARYDR